MKLGRVGEELVEVTLQPELLQKERRGKEERRKLVVEVRWEETKVVRKEETRVVRKEETALDRKGRVDAAMITLAEVSHRMRRAANCEE